MEMMKTWIKAGSVPSSFTITTRIPIQNGKFRQSIRRLLGKEKPGQGQDKVERSKSEKNKFQKNRSSKDLGSKKRLAKFHR